jgi:hypothetical protein
MINFDAISESYTAAKQQLNSAQLELDEAEAKAAELSDRRAAAVEERDRLLEREQSDHVIRVLDGEQSAPKKPKRLTRIANLQDEIAGIDLAIPIHQGRVQEASARRNAARENVAEAVMPSILDQKVEAFARCAQPLAELIDALVDAAAIDTFQDQFAGAGGALPISNGVDRGKLFSARIILDRFLKTLPPRFADLAADKLASVDSCIAAKARSFAHQIGA